MLLTAVNFCTAITILTCMHEQNVSLQKCPTPKFITSEVGLLYSAAIPAARMRGAMKGAARPRASFVFATVEEEDADEEVRVEVLEVAVLELAIDTYSLRHGTY